jgi:hypothetical protein
MIIKPWLLLRLLVLAYVMWVGFTNRANSYITWHEAILAPALTPIFLFLWLSIMLSGPYSRGRRKTDWSDPYSITKPFFPIGRYPERFAHLMSTMALLGGFASFVRDLFSGGNIHPDTCMSLLWAISIFITLLVFRKKIRDIM